MNNISVNLENLTDKERDTLLSLIEKANKKADNRNDRWKPEEGDFYYYTDSMGAVGKEQWGKGNHHHLRYTMGNVFKTEEEAKLAQGKRLLTTMLEDFARKHNGEFRGCKYYLAANKHEDGSYYVEIDSQYENIASHYVREYPMPSFSSRYVALKAIMEIGEEYLLRYYFQVI